MVSRVYVTNEAGHPLPVEVVQPLFHYMHFDSADKLLETVPKAASLDEAMNHYGDQSWELVGITATGAMFFKRMIRRH